MGQTSGVCWARGMLFWLCIRSRSALVDTVNRTAPSSPIPLGALALLCQAFKLAVHLLALLQFILHQRSSMALL